MRKALLVSAASLGFASTPPAAATGKPPEPAKAPKKPAASVLGTVTGITPPESRRGGFASQFPFDKLEVGESFGVKGRDKRGISSAVSNANRKFRKDITNEQNIVTGTEQIKHFIAFDVTPEIAKAIKGTEAEGATVLVQRDK